MNQPEFSIIIPCYNQGHYLVDAIQSVEKCNPKLYELIIINDGSNDDRTLNIFKELESKGYSIIHQENVGLSGARNTGILKAKGKYILPLDADNMIRPEYLTDSINLFESNSNISIIYGNPCFFGEKNGEKKIGNFNLQKLMIANYIDACAIVKKSVFSEIGYYNTNLKLGLEDWELWLRLGFKGYEFYYIDKVLYDYRVIKNSMSKQLLNFYAKRNKAEKDIENLHKNKLGKDYITDYFIKRFKSNPLLFLMKIVIISYFPSVYKKLLNKNKIVRGI